MQFGAEQYKNDQLMLAQKLAKTIYQKVIPYDGDLLHTMIYIYTEAQMWSDVSALLKQ